jgi:hypothetical protein
MRNGSRRRGLAEAEWVAETVPWLAWGAQTGRRHDRYRRPVDLPCGGHAVRLLVTVRRFVCGNAGYPRRTSHATALLVPCD